MSSGRLFIGGLSNSSTEHDVEDFFRGYGKIVEVVLKKGFGFVQFEDKYDAEDALKDLNGKKMCGERINLEVPNRDTMRAGNRGGSDRNYRSYDRSYGSYRGPPPYRNSFRSIATAPHLSRHRLLVENLTTRYGWKELKELMSDCYPTFADAHKKEKHLAILCFNSRSDLKSAMEKYQGKEINGRKIRLVDDSKDSRSRSSSRSPTRKRRTPSRSRSGSPMRKRRVRSRSPAHKRARSESHSKSPAPSKRAKSHSRSASSSSRSRSRSRSLQRKSKKSHTPSRSRGSSSSRSSKSPVPKAEVNGHRSRSDTPSSNKSRSVEKQIKSEMD